LPLLNADVTINGNGNTVSGNNQYRVFFAQQGTVSFNNLTIADGKAQGGNGGAGGGAGLGGGLFVNAANVQLSGVQFTSNGGAGGTGTNGGGCGGGFYAAGGDASGADGGSGGNRGGGGGRGGWNFGAVSRSGGAVFVNAANGGSLAWSGGGQSGGATTGGAAGAWSGQGFAADAGSAAGTALFLRGGTVDLSVAGGNTANLSGDIADAAGEATSHPGAITKLGTGTVVLNGNSAGTFGYAGGTAVNAGTLTADLVIQNASTLAPGNSRGTLSVPMSPSQTDRVHRRHRLHRVHVQRG